MLQPLKASIKTTQALPKFARFALFLSLATTPIATANQANMELPPGGVFEQERLASLWHNIAQTYDCRIETQVNDRSVARLFEVRFQGDRNNGKITIPPEIARIWPFFDRLVLTGSELRTDGGLFYLSSPLGRQQIHTYGNNYRVSTHANRLKVDDRADYAEHYLEVPDNVIIEQIILSNELGVSERFDKTEWTTLGADKPIESVSITLNTTQARAIAGETKLLRNRFWRVAGSYNASTRNTPLMEFCIERGFYPGRGIKKLDGLEEWGFAGRKLTESPEQTGRPDYTIFEEIHPAYHEINRRDALFGNGMTWANCFDNWPAFMSLKDTVEPNNRGTPANYDDAAELASRYIGAEKDHYGRTADWWEVKNEATVPSEWVLHSEPGYNGWAELAAFHITMAERIRQDHPEVKVGGPASAWMALDHANFNVAQEQMDFMDATKGKLDFYSHHFYENTDLVLNGGEAHSGGYLTGRFEGVIDLLWNYGHLTNNVKPWLITEYGTLGGGDHDRIQWVEIKNYNSYLIRMMNQQDKLHLTNAFILPFMHWDKESRSGLYIHDENGQPTLNNKLYYYLDFWKDYQGDLLPTQRTNPAHTAVHTHAVTDGNTVYLAINNMNSHRIAVDLETILGNRTVIQAQQHRMYLEGATIIKETIPLRSSKNIPVAVEETTLIEITLDKAPQLSQKLDQHTFYGDSILQPTGSSTSFTINIEPGRIATARLRVCAARQGGFDQAIEVRFNGKKLPQAIELTPEQKAGRYWGWAEFTVPAQWVQPENEAQIHIDQYGGYITSVALITEYIEPLNQ